MNGSFRLKNEGKCKAKCVERKRRTEHSARTHGAPGAVCEMRPVVFLIPLMQKFVCFSCEDINHTVCNKDSDAVKID